MHFSVVIPLYNKEDYILRSINSVINQTYRDFELLIIDDGSTDSSSSVIKKVKDNRIKYFKQENLGVSAARNKGIELAKYDYIAFLDADDTWEPDFLESVRVLIHKYPKAGVYGTAYKFKDNDSITVIPSSILTFKKGWEGIIDDYFEIILKNGPLITASSVVIPKYIFDKIGGFVVGIKRGEDLNMWTRIALHYKIAFVNKSLATYYRDVSDSATKKRGSLYESSVQFAENMLIEGRSKINYSRYFEEYMIKSIIIKARYFISENKRKKARQLLFKYKYTKYNKKELVKVFLLTFLDENVVKISSELKRRIKSY